MVMILGDQDDCRGDVQVLDLQTKYTRDTIPSRAPLTRSTHQIVFTQLEHALTPEDGIAQNDSDTPSVIISPLPSSQVYASPLSPSSHPQLLQVHPIKPPYQPFPKRA